MKQETSENNQKQAESQPLDAALQARIRIIMMKRRFRYLDQRYLAKKLKRSEMAISYALNGKRNQLLARITKHLDWLERKDAEKLAA
jgi:hypothetical protein